MTAPDDLSDDAPVITRDEIVIAAPIQTIWDIQTDVAGWPSWQPDVDDAAIDGPLSVGYVFRRKGSSPSTSGPSTSKPTGCSSEPPSLGRVIPSTRSPSRYKRLRAT